MVETTPRKVFAAALDWPGLARGAKDEGFEVEALHVAVRRYSRVVDAAGHAFDPDTLDLDVVERT